MVIVKIEQCLNQLNNEVKKKIIQTQDDILPSEQVGCIHERFRSSQFRKKLLNRLSDVEQKFFSCFLKKYGLLVSDTEKEEQTASTEEKLALLLLRQKGLVFEVDKSNGNKSFVMPIEISESFFELQFNKNKVDFSGDLPILTKSYLYFLMELIFLIDEKKVRKSEELADFNECFSTVNVALLLKFLEHEGLVTKSKKQFSISEENCNEFFKRDDKEIKQSLTLFFLFNYLEDSQIVLYIVWLLFSRPQKSVAISEIITYVTENSQINSAQLDEVVKQLILLEIITKIDDNIIVLSADEFPDRETQRGIMVGVHEFLVPVYTNNHVLWNFRRWGEFVQWEAMVQVSFTKETVLVALKKKQDYKKLINNLQQCLTKTDVIFMQETIDKWLENGHSITKKENVTLYSITEKLHVKYIKEHWPHWWIKTDNGVIVDKELETKFEQLLKRCSLTVIEDLEQGEIEQQQLQIKIVNVYPETSTVFPQVDQLPKQWFILTAYEERTLQRIIKQAMILQLFIRIQQGNGDIVKLDPVKVNIDNGCYVVYGRDNKKITFQQIKKVAVIHPLEM